MVRADVVNYMQGHGALRTLADELYLQDNFRYAEESTSVLNNRNTASTVLPNAHTSR